MVKVEGTSFYKFKREKAGDLPKELKGMFTGIEPAKRAKILYDAKKNNSTK